jgi:hypothetical protein
MMIWREPCGHPIDASRAVIVVVLAPVPAPALAVFFLLVKVAAQDVLVGPALALECAMALFAPRVVLRLGLLKREGAQVLCGLASGACLFHAT